MKALITVCVGVWLVGCTKPNPDLCCNDAADCAAQNLPADDACAEGLVCRGNQCIAETCSDASECDAAAPYCVGDACAEQCTMDAQCPGFGGASTDPFCVAGGCVECRDSGDCSGNTPICDANACRGCNANTDCSSGLCNLGTGACVDASSLLYASPGGADTAACTEADPCSITHAIASVTVALNTILMAPGTYAATITISSGATMTLLGGGATLGARLTIANSSKVSIQNLTLTGLWCYDTTSAPDSELTLVSSTVNSETGFHFLTEHCHIAMSQVTTTGEFDIEDEASLQADRSVVTNVNLASAKTFQGSLTNSIFAGFDTPQSGTNSITIDVFYSTLQYGNSLSCVSPTTAGVSLVYTNVVAFSTPFAINTGTGVVSGCFDHVIAYPQPGGVPDGVIVEDPMMVDPVNGNYHLKAGSPAIDAADGSIPDAHDFDGVSRPQGAGFDIGAFEYH